MAYKAVKNVADAASGAAAGAAAGSVVPGVGTVIGAGIGGLTNLVSGLFGAAAAREQQRREMKYQADMKRYDNDIGAEKNRNAGTQNAFSQLLDQYRAAMVR